LQGCMSSEGQTQARRLNCTPNRGRHKVECIIESLWPVGGEIQKTKKSPRSYFWGRPAQQFSPIFKKKRDLVPKKGRKSGKSSNHQGTGGCRCKKAKGKRSSNLNQRSTKKKTNLNSRIELLKGARPDGRGRSPIGKTSLKEWFVAKKNMKFPRRNKREKGVVYQKKKGERPIKSHQ